MTIVWLDTETGEKWELTLDENGRVTSMVLLGETA